MTLKIEYRDRKYGRTGLVKDSNGNVRYFSKEDAEAYMSRNRSQTCQFWIATH